MRLLSTGIVTSVTALLLSGCAGTVSSPSSTMPGSLGHAGLHGSPISVIPEKYLARRAKPFRGKIAPDVARRGIYVSALLDSHLYGFTKNNAGNGPPTCSVPATDVNGFGVDNSGNLIIPEGRGGITVWIGPAMCGKPQAPQTIDDPFGDADDASAVDAVNGKIVVADFFDFIGAGSVTICTLASGSCSPNLTSPNMALVAGVAINSAGDCWADALGSNGLAALVYFAGCAGSGQLATGFTNGFFGGIDIDSKGNLVTTSLLGPDLAPPSTVNVYSGCNPACTLLSSTALNGLSIYGHVGRQNSRYVTTNLETGDVEVYHYKKTGVTPFYSFAGGLPCITDICEAAAYNPGSPKSEG